MKRTDVFGFGDETKRTLEAIQARLSKLEAMEEHYRTQTIPAVETATQKVAPLVNAIASNMLLQGAYIQDLRKNIEDLDERVGVSPPSAPPAAVVVPPVQPQPLPSYGVTSNVKNMVQNTQPCVYQLLHAPAVFSR